MKMPKCLTSLMQRLCKKKEPKKMGQVTDLRIDIQADIISFTLPPDSTRGAEIFISPTESFVRRDALKSMHVKEPDEKTPGVKKVAVKITEMNGKECEKNDGQNFVHIITLGRVVDRINDSDPLSVPLITTMDQDEVQTDLPPKNETEKQTTTEQPKTENSNERKSMSATKKVYLIWTGVILAAIGGIWIMYYGYTHNVCGVKTLFHNNSHHLPIIAGDTSTPVTLAPKTNQPPVISPVTTVSNVTNSGTITLIPGTGYITVSGNSGNVYINAPTNVINVTITNIVNMPPPPPAPPKPAEQQKQNCDNTVGQAQPSQNQSPPRTMTQKEALDYLYNDGYAFNDAFYNQDFFGNNRGY